MICAPDSFHVYKLAIYMLPRDPCICAADIVTDEVSITQGSPDDAQVMATIESAEDNVIYFNGPEDGFDSAEGSMGDKAAHVVTSRSELDCETFL
jgi:hypothetical protein